MNIYRYDQRTSIQYREFKFGDRRGYYDTEMYYLKSL